MTWRFCCERVPREVGGANSWEVISLRIFNYLAIPFIATVIVLSGCSSRGLPETPERAKRTDAVVHRLLSDAYIEEPKAKSELETRQDIRLAIQQRKNDIGRTLPDAYWLKAEEFAYQYSREVEFFQQNAIRDYKRKMKSRLARASDEQLDVLIRSEEMKNTAEFKRFIVGTERDLLLLHLLMNPHAVRSRYVEQMKELDSKYDVCAMISTCWK